MAKWNLVKRKDIIAAMKCVWMIQQTAGILKDDTEPNEVTESGNEFHAVVSNSSCSKTVLKLS